MQTTLSEMAKAKPVAWLRLSDSSSNLAKVTGDQDNAPTSALAGVKTQVMTKTQGLMTEAQGRLMPSIRAHYSVQSLGSWVMGWEVRSWQS